MSINWNHFLEEQSRLSAKLNAFHPVTGERIFGEAGLVVLSDMKEEPWRIPWGKERALSKGAIGMVQILEGSNARDPWLVAGGYHSDTRRIYIWANGDVANCPEKYKPVLKSWTQLVLDLHDEKRTARRVQGRVKRFKEELMMEMWRPERVERLLESGDLEAVI